MKAAELPYNLTWINARAPLRLAELRGQVVLLDFLTFSCVNCKQTLGDLQWLEHKYANDPFVVIGIHSARSDEERFEAYIRSEIARYEIRYPIVVDDERIIGNSYGIRDCTSFVLIDAEGLIIGNTTGSGKLWILDQAIRTALDEGKAHGKLSDKKVTFAPDTFPGP